MASSAISASRVNSSASAGRALKAASLAGPWRCSRTATKNSPFSTIRLRFVAIASTLDARQIVGRSDDHPGSSEAGGLAPLYYEGTSGSESRTARACNAEPSFASRLATTEPAIQPRSAADTGFGRSTVATLTGHAAPDGLATLPANDDLLDKTETAHFLDAGQDIGLARLVVTLGIDSAGHFHPLASAVKVRISSP